MTEKQNGSPKNIAGMGGPDEPTIYPTFHRMLEFYTIPYRQNTTYQNQKLNMETAS